MSVTRLLVLFALSAATAAAQRYADLYGRILDTTYGGIADATVTVTNQDTGFRRVTQSETGGAYQVGSLQPGTYKITVRKEGFVSRAQFDVRLADAATRADFVLSVGSIEETITVYGNPPEFEREHEDASTGSRVEHEEIERLPLNGGGVLNLLELTPGTNVTPATRGEAGQFSTSGQRPNTNYFTIDGASANTGVTAGGLPAQSTGGAFPALSAFGSLDSLISLDAVQEFRVTTSTSVAEFGRLPGAIVALSSRSGTNEFHGSTGYRIRNELLNANDWFGNQAGFGTLPLRLQDFAQTFGGPVKRNRTFFFLSYERMALVQPFVWRQPVPSLDVRQTAADWAQPLLALFPAPNSGALTGDVGEWVGRTVRPAGLNVGGARIDQAITSRISFFGRYNDSPSNNQFGTLTANDLDLRSRSLTLGLNARLSANLNLDFRANESQVNANSVWISPGDPCALQPLVAVFDRDPTPCDYLVRFSIAGVGQLVSGSEGDRRQRQFQAVQSASYRLHRHTLGLGADYRRILAVRRDHTGSLGLIADQISDLSNSRNVWFDNSSAQNASAEINELSLWVQDTWQATSRMTVAGGLRWEYSPSPVPATDVYFLNPTTNTVFRTQQPLWPTSYRDFAPRLGVAYRLTADGRTVLRAGGGLYYDSSLSIATDFLTGGPLNASSLGFSSGRNGLFSTQLIFGFMPGLRLPRVEQWNVSLERAFGTHDVVSIGYLGSEGHSLLRREMGGAGSSPTSYVALITNNGSSNYQALQLQYRRRVARGLQSLVAYAWSHSIDNDSSDAFLVWSTPGFSDKGSSDFDLRHSLTGSLSYEFAQAKSTAPLARLLGGWAMDTIFRARSGFPISVLNSEEYLGINLANAFRPDLVFGVPQWLAAPGAPGGRILNPAAFQGTVAPQQGTLGRNVLGGFGMAQLDFALRREFRLTERRRLQFRLEAFNVSNHANFADPVRYLNSPVFGQSTSMLNLMLGTGSPGSGLAPILQTGGPRSLQASLRFQF
ncbi:TonB-dependent receptor, plug [Candidatus Sulfopaludibacter sp. SbA4]|nr:TonB-dependent receptor, plug [Candidatus Sulfopaludibacter sp. SbA4]